MKNAQVGTLVREQKAHKSAFILLSFAAFVLACALAASARGQDAAASQITGDYYVADMGPFSDPNNVKELESRFRQAITDREATAGSASLNIVSQYFGNYLWKKMTQPESAPDIAELVYDTLRNLERMERSGSSEAYTEARNQLKRYMAGIAANQVEGKYFSPAARLGATMILANMNEAGPDNGRPPRPEFAVTATLRKLLDDANAPAGIRLVALNGLRRHAQLISTAPASAQAGAKKMYLDYANSILANNNPNGLTRENLGTEAFAFAQRYAIDMVVWAGSPEEHKALATRLNTIVADPSSSPLVAFYAAKVLGTLNKDALKAVEVTPPVVVAWADVALQSLTNEIDRIKSLDRPKFVISQNITAKDKDERRNTGGGSGGVRGPAGGGGTGGMGAGSGYDAGYGEGPGGYPGGDPTGGMGGGDYGAGYGMGPGGYGAASANPQPVEVISARRRLNLHFEGLLTGLHGGIDPDKPATGIVANAQGEAQQRADELLATMRTITDAVNTKSYDTRVKFLAMLEEQHKELAKWVERNKPVEEAPAEGEEAPAGPEGSDVASN